MDTLRVEIAEKLSFRDLLALRVAIPKLIPVGIEIHKTPYCTVEHIHMFPNQSQIPYKVDRIFDENLGDRAHYRRFSNIIYRRFECGYTMVATVKTHQPQNAIGNVVMFVVINGFCSKVVQTYGIRSADINVYEFDESTDLFSAINAYMAYGTNIGEPTVRLHGIRYVPIVSTVRKLESSGRKMLYTAMYSNNFSSSMMN